MRKIALLLFSTMLLSQLFAGGILTNTNQSAMFTRMQARDATLGIDAVYYNPAGLNFLSGDGLYVSLSNQTLGSTRNISSDYTYLNTADYVGDIFAPVFPSIYAAYKMDKFVFSAGFNPIGGGGGGTYETGLPFFEYSISDLVPSLATQGAQGYRMDAYFEGSAAYFGYQANISYKINDKLAVALGGRYVQAKESYNGHLNDVALNMGGTWMPASGVMSGVAAQTAAGATSATGAATSMQTLVDGAGALTFDQAGVDAAIQTQLEGGLTQLGIDPTGMTIAQVQGAYSAAALSLASMSARSTATSALLQNQSADYEKTASGFTPIISIDYKPNDQLNFSFKYEHQTSLEFTNKTDPGNDFITGYTAAGTPITMFPDGGKTNLDLPTQIVVGATYRPMDKLLISTGFHSYLDKNADWDGRQDKLDGNSWEFALGLEYDLSDMFLVSAGWLRTKSGANGAYQDNLSYSLPSHTFGAGFAANITEKLQLNLAGAFTGYAPMDKMDVRNLGGTGPEVNFTETYDKDVWIVSVGINYFFGNVN